MLNHHLRLVTCCCTHSCADFSQSVLPVTVFLCIDSGWVLENTKEVQCLFEGLTESPAHDGGPRVASLLLCLQVFVDASQHLRRPILQQIVHLGTQPI